MKPVRLAIASLVLCAVSAGAQARGTRVELQSTSWLELEGVTTIGSFICRTSHINATALIDGPEAARLASLNRVVQSMTIVIPVKTLKCDKPGMAPNLFKALKSDEYPEIRYSQTTYEVSEGATLDAPFTVRSTGELTIGGKTRVIEMPVRTDRTALGDARARGEHPLLMTDYGIKPPKLAMGALKTKNRIVVRFSLFAAPRSIAVLAGQRVE